MRIDGLRQTAAAYAPERRQKEAGGSAERRLRFAVASNVPFDVEDVESETLRAPSRNAQTRSVSEGDYISAERKFLALEQRASPPRDALFVGRRALQTFERRLKSGTVSVVSRVAHNGKEL